ncbi:MAG: hypothetical protein FJZ95_03980 [Chloroflexi bacterium]|nr:hypothetical protein [Chloroflexota bacterium]
MIKSRGRSIGRRVLGSAKMMNLLPWVGVGVAVIGLIGLVLGIVIVLISALPLAGAAIITLGLALTLTGIVLFFAMCIVQDITGMF